MSNSVLSTVHHFRPFEGESAQAQRHPPHGLVCRRESTMIPIISPTKKRPRRDQSPRIIACAATVVSEAVTTDPLEHYYSEHDWDVIHDPLSVFGGRDHDDVKEDEDDDDATTRRMKRQRSSSTLGIPRCYPIDPWDSFSVLLGAMTAPAPQACSNGDDVVDLSSCGSISYDSKIAFGSTNQQSAQDEEDDDDYLFDTLFQFVAENDEQLMPEEQPHVRRTMDSLLLLPTPIPEQRCDGNGCTPFPAGAVISFVSDHGQRTSYSDYDQVSDLSDDDFNIHEGEDDDDFCW